VNGQWSMVNGGEPVLSVNVLILKNNDCSIKEVCS